MFTNPVTGPNLQPDESSPSYYFNIHFNIILHSAFHIKNLYTHLFSPMHPTYPAHLILLNFIFLIAPGNQ